MPTNIRLTKEEQEELRTAAVKLNKKLIQMEKEPVKDAELAHLALKYGIRLLEVNARGEVIIVQ